MERKKSKNQKTSKNKIEIELDLRHCSNKYSGLEVSPSNLSDSPNEGTCDTIIIPEWVRPENGETW